jgi:hypothetical protein
MEKIYLSVVIICSLLATAVSATAENQFWTVRPGDNLDMIASTLELSKQEIKKQNPGILESNLQVGQKLKLPFRAYAESKALEQELDNRAQQIRELESKKSDLANQLATVEAQLRWHPIWLWGFWICFGILAFIVGSAYWIFRQTHPRVFEPHDRSVSDLRESQRRLRTGFTQEDAVNSQDQWRPSFNRLHAHR